MAEIQASNPELFQVRSFVRSPWRRTKLTRGWQLINANQAEFMQYINEGAEGGESGEGEDDDMAALMDQFGDGGEGDGGQYIQVTEEEKAAIDRLVGMGFERQMVSLRSRDPCGGRS